MSAPAGSTRAEILLDALAQLTVAVLATAAIVAGLWEAAK